ncbi:short-chain dehydrogenase reductase [Lasallia pustulata]|uniref:Short-chain dehydrogenase reductase n=1 Tax=Lasallia pustulata TaxID=136370 RepID=A0A1W5D485_9LECA|nr:short-chain dehydrogenase reductase [Lasallia pustulata]
MSKYTVLITGASGGIGSATAIRLGSEADRIGIVAIAMHYNSNHQLAEKVKAKIESESNPHIKIGIFQADLALSEDIARLHKEVTDAFGTIDILFANAGTSAGKNIGPKGNIEDVSLEIFEATWRVNALASFQLTQLVVPSMARRSFGRVIYNSSVAALTGGVVGPHYASSKSALHGMLHFLAMRYAKDGVTFNAVAPALIEDTLLLPQGSGELKGRIPVGRLGKPDEVASVVQVMIENGYITNKVWAIDGGWHPS